MDTTYRLTQTGKQVQDLLDQVTPNEVNIAAETQRATAAEQAIHGDVSAETTRAETAEAALQSNINSEESARIAADSVLQGKIDDEKARAQAAEQAILGDLSDETARAEGAEATLQGNIDDEAAARQSADSTLQGNINAEAVARQNADSTLQGNIDAEAAARQNADSTLQGSIDAEEARATAAEQANATVIAGIEAKIPADASAQNQLADKAFVNSSVATATATFMGTYNLVADLHLNVGATRAQIIAELNATIQDADNNDYCFVQIPVATSKPAEIAAVDRYKFNGNTWAFEYSLNNSGYTEAQWDAINSGITSGLVTKLDALPTNSDIVNLLAGKQDVLTFDVTPRSNSTNPVTSEGIKAAIDASSSADALDDEIARATAAEQANASAIVAETNRASAAEAVIQEKIDAEEAARQSADATLRENITDEETRAKAAEQANADDIDVIESKIPSAATSQNQLTDKAYVDAGLAGKQDALTFDQTPTANSTNPVTSTGIKGYVDTAVGNEETRAKAAEQVNALAIDDVEALIPTQASASNQLADKAFVNSSIATNTGDFVGTYNSLAELQADNPNPNNNDYGYVVSTDQQGNTSYSRYKYSSNSQAWEFEYALNNSSFTADEWAAIQSGITAALVGKLGDLYTKAQLDVILDSKQSALTFDNVPTAGSDNPVKSGGIYNALSDKADKVSGATENDFAGLDANGNLKDSGKKASDFATAAQGLLADTAYQKPSTGIPSTDLASGVNTSLGKADTAYQKPSTGIPETDLDAATQQKINTAVDISGKADKVSGATENDFAGLDANGNLKDSGKKASDFATAAQGALADTAYQKPSGGIPSTDLASAVNTSLGKADTAYQKPSGGIPYADLAANAKGLPIGTGTATSLASLPVTNHLIIATISANQSAVSINNGISALPAGAELHVIIHATAAVTITLPTSSPYVNCNAESALEVASGGYAELNFVSDGTNIYVRGIV